MRPKPYAPKIQFTVQTQDGILQFGTLNRQFQVAEPQAEQLIVRQGFPRIAKFARVSGAGGSCYCHWANLTVKRLVWDEVCDRWGGELHEIIATDGLLQKPTITIETVTTLEGIAALGPCYERLNRVIRNTLPFALHEWHVTWCRHFLNCNPRISDQPLFFVLHNSTGDCVALFPFIVSRRRVGPLTLVSINNLGADPAITEIRAPLIEPGFEQSAAHAVRDRLAKLSCWDWIHWTGISDELAEPLARGARLQWQPVLPDYVLDLPPTWEEFRQGLKRNIRESLRHCYNSLKRDNHSFEFQVMQEPAEIQAGLGRFLELHVMRANLTDTVIHPNRFESQVSREFLYVVCARLAERGAVRLFALKIDAQVVAMRIGFVVGESLYMYYSGFDPEWSRYSVMTTTLAEAIKYAIGHGHKLISLSPNKDVSKSRWGPRQVDYGSAIEQGVGLHSRLATRAYLKARSDPGHQSWFVRHLIPGRRTWR
jgi:CelD/BcsL family acetyltransferase involved in cellulose biosynthesis